MSTNPLRRVKPARSGYRPYLAVFSFARHTPFLHFTHGPLHCAVKPFGGHALASDD